MAVTLLNHPTLQAFSFRVVSSVFCVPGFFLCFLLHFIRHPPLYHERVGGMLACQSWTKTAELKIGTNLISLLEEARNLFQSFQSAVSLIGQRASQSNIPKGILVYHSYCWNGNYNMHVTFSLCLIGSKLRLNSSSVCFRCSNKLVLSLICTDIFMSTRDCVKRSAEKVMLQPAAGCRLSEKSTTKM